MDYVLKEIQTVARQYPDIQRIVLFGSRARGDNTVHSDYDLAIFAGEKLPRTAFQNAVENISTLHKLDLVFITARHKESDLYRNILQDGVDIVNKFQTKFSNYQKALSRLHEGLDEANKSKSLTVRDGVIQRFEFTSELAWKTVREYLLTLEVININSPKPVMQEAFNNGLIHDEQGWLQILQDRNSTAHIYDEEDAEAVFNRIKTVHIRLFDALKNDLIPKANATTL